MALSEEFQVHPVKLCHLPMEKKFIKHDTFDIVRTVIPQLYLMYSILGIQHTSVHTV